MFSYVTMELRLIKVNEERMMQKFSLKNKDLVMILKIRIYKL